MKHLYLTDFFIGGRGSLAQKTRPRLRPRRWSKINFLSLNFVLSQSPQSPLRPSTILYNLIRSPPTSTRVIALSELFYFPSRDTLTFICLFRVFSAAISPRVPLFFSYCWRQRLIFYLEGLHPSLSDSTVYSWINSNYSRLYVKTFSFTFTDESHCQFSWPQFTAKTHS